MHWFWAHKIGKAHARTLLCTSDTKHTWRTNPIATHAQWAVSEEFTHPVGKIWSRSNLLVGTGLGFWIWKTVIGKCRRNPYASSQRCAKKGASEKMAHCPGIYRKCLSAQTKHNLNTFRPKKTRRWCLLKSCDAQILSGRPRIIIWNINYNRSDIHWDVQSEKKMQQLMSIASFDDTFMINLKTVFL